VVQRLDAPVPADVIGEAGGACLGGVQVGDGVPGHGAPLVAGKWPDSAGDADGLGGVGEVQASDGGCLQAADLGATVAAVAGVVLGGDLAPGQAL
jgi:hypothetical protein